MKKAREMLRNQLFLNKIFISSFYLGEKALKYHVVVIINQNILCKDNVVTAMYASAGTEQKMAQEVLTTLKEHPDAWQKVI